MGEKIITLYQKCIKLISNKINIANPIFKTTFWSMFGDILSKGLLFVSWIAVGRILGKESYGEFGIIRTTINMFAIFGGMGLGLTANKFLAEHSIANKVYSGKIVTLTNRISVISGLSIAALIFFGSHYLSYTLLKAPQLETELKISSLILFLSCLNGAQIGILQGLSAFRELAIVNLWQGLSALPLFVLGTYFFGVLGSIIAYALVILIFTIILKLKVNAVLQERRIISINTNIKEVFPILWQFSLPAALTGIAVSPFKWYSEALLSNNSGFGQLGIFQAAFVISNVIIAVSSSLNAPLISLTSNLKEFKKSNKLQYITIYGSWYLFLFLAIPFLLFPELALLIFGEKFNDPNLYKANLLLLCYCGMLMYYQGISRVIAINNSLWFAFATNIFEGITLITSFYFLKSYGALGLGFAYVASYIVRISVSIPFLIKKNLITPKMLFERYFVITFLLFLGVVYFLM